MCHYSQIQFVLVASVAGGVLAFEAYQGSALKVEASDGMGLGTMVVVLESLLYEHCCCRFKAVSLFCKAEIPAGNLSVPAVIEIAGSGNLSFF